jgi:anti-sigma-K factor RskA
MNYLRPELLDALARAHALGTLSPGAARRFSRVVAGSAAAAQAVADWQDVLHTLEQGAPPAPAPRPRVWEGVQQRLFARDERAHPAAPAGASRARGGPLAGWLRWPAGLVAGALLSWSVLVLRPQTFDMEARTGVAPASYVGVLQDPQGHPLLATAARRQGQVLTVRLLRPVPIEAGHALTLWAWNDADPAPRRVGSWTTPGATSTVALPAPAEALLGTMTHLGLSDEPTAAVPASPTRPFVAEGPCAKVW